MDTVKVIRGYFAQFYKQSLKDTDNLFVSGALDSMGIVNLMAYIEEKLGIMIDPDDINEENFSTIKNIVALIERKK